MAGVGSATLLCLTENSACARQNTLTKTGTRPKLTIFADKPTQHLLLLTLEFGKKHTNIQVFSNGWSVSTQFCGCVARCSRVSPTSGGRSSAARPACCAAAGRSCRSARGLAKWLCVLSASWERKRPVRYEEIVKKFHANQALEKDDGQKIFSFGGYIGVKWAFSVDSRWCAAFALICAGPWICWPYAVHHLKCHSSRKLPDFGKWRGKGCSCN